MAKSKKKVVKVVKVESAESSVESQTNDGILVSVPNTQILSDIQDVVSGAVPKSPQTNIISVRVSSDTKQMLSESCDKQGLTTSFVLDKLIGWFVCQNKTEQSLILGNIEDADAASVAEIILRNRK